MVVNIKLYKPFCSCVIYFLCVLPSAPFTALSPWKT